MDPARVDNNTEFVAEPRLLVGKTGEQLVTVVKATFECFPGESSLEFAPFERQRGIRSADIPWGDPQKSSIRYPTDVCIAKPGTDVIVVAAAHAPEGKAVPTFDAGIRAGRLEKLIRIFGLRVWEAEGQGLSAPRPIQRIEVRYDYAWGGIDASDPAEIVEESRNPVGMGIARDADTLTHQPAPHIEDPAFPIRSVRTSPPPAGLGAIGRHWEPRRQFMGTYDETWLQNRAPLLPLDHDDRTNMCASPGLSALPPFSGGEQVALLNLTPGGGTVAFVLPQIRLTIECTTPKRAPQRVAPHLDTVIIDTLDVEIPGRVTVELVWRAAFHPSRRMKDARIIIDKEAS